MKHHVFKKSPDNFGYIFLTKSLIKSLCEVQALSDACQTVTGLSTHVHCVAAYLYHSALLRALAHGVERIRDDVVTVH